MPLYDYRCRKCGETFEVKQRFSDDPLTIHEGCAGELERLISVPALQFKGSGWYITDYARGSQKPSTDSTAGNKTDSKPSAPAGESKSESKPAPAKATAE